MNKFIKMLRLSDEESMLLKKAWIEINKNLISQGHEGIKESELAHICLQLSLKRIKVNKYGQLEI